jgi:ubiquinone/menaquinone biosynthesis C-methylase UbiE
MAFQPKQNVNAFNRDAESNDGYQYTTNAPYSSKVANQRMTDATVECIGPHVKTILDLGCGDGAYTASLKKLFPQIRFVGVDAAAKAIAGAQAKYPDVDFKVANALDYSTFPQERFDLAIARGVLHHVPDAKVALQNLMRCADEVLIIEPNGNNPVLKVIEVVSPYHREHEEQSFSARALTAWTKSAGGEVVSLSYVGFVPFFFPTLPAKVIHGLQPMLEKVPVVREVLSAQIVMRVRSNVARNSP